MAQVSNVILEIGTINVGPERSFPVLPPPPPPDTREYRLVTVRANLNFAPQEIGLSYKLYAALYSTDNPSEDIDSFGGSAPFLLREDAGVTELSNMVKDNRFIVFVPKGYETISVTASTMPISFSKNLLLKTLNEDEDLTIFSFPNPPRTIYLQDELFARVWLTTVGQSAVTHTAIR
ncbi:MAG: hypothetical protein U5N85_05180 [Arcicella sp.]|nr:hypothetical protein [Arcicella sp.]